MGLRLTETGVESLAVPEPSPCMLLLTGMIMGALASCLRNHKPAQRFVGVRIVATGEASVRKSLQAISQTRSCYFGTSECNGRSGSCEHVEALV